MNNLLYKLYYDLYLPFYPYVITAAVIAAFLLA